MTNFIKKDKNQIIKSMVMKSPQYNWVDFDLYGLITFTHFPKSLTIKYLDLNTNVCEIYKRKMKFKDYFKNLFDFSLNRENFFIKLCGKVITIPKRNTNCLDTKRLNNGKNPIWRFRVEKIKNFIK